MNPIKTQLGRTVALSLAMLASASAYADPTILNGSFEAQTIASGTSYTGTITDWIKTFHGPVALVSGDLIDGNGASYGVTPFGNNYVGLDPFASFKAGVSQVVSGFTAGQTYALTLYVADADGGKAPLLDVLFSDGGSNTYQDTLYNVPVGGPYGDVIGFNQVVIDFTAPVSGDITLGLFNDGNTHTTTDPGSISIDNISIAAVSAVPEASNAASLLAGLGVLGALLGRRRRVASATA